MTGFICCQRVPPPQRTFWSLKKVVDLQATSRLIAKPQNTTPKGKVCTPLYNTSILVTKKPVSRIFFFGHFLVRLSGNKRSQVISIANFCWAHSNFGYENLAHFGPDSGQVAGKRPAERPPTGKLKLSRVTSGYGGLKIPLGQIRLTPKKGGFMGVA